MPAPGLCGVRDVRIERPDGRTWAPTDGDAVVDARQIGLNAADKVLFIADGAPWIWRRLQRLIAALGLSPTQVLGGGGRKHIELAGDPEGREINMARRPVAIRVINLRGASIAWVRSYKSGRWNC